MACFLVSAAAALGVGVAKHVVAHNEKKAVNVENKNYSLVKESKWSTKLTYLELTLWSGSFMLAGEHVLHGEVQPFAPFLTATTTPEGTMEMLQEMGTAGVTMAVVLVAAWAVGVFLHDFLKFKKRQKNTVGETK